MTGPADDLSRNTALWTDVNAQLTDDYAFASWARDVVRWGLFEVPDATTGALGDVAGLDVVELGCGTAFLSARLARRGARPVGVDLTPAQLRRRGAARSASTCTSRSSRRAPRTCRSPRGSFDLAVSEYGASVWCDPARWLREAARLLRPGGRLVFLTNSVLADCACRPTGHARTRCCDRSAACTGCEWAGGGVEFHPGHGDWIRLLAANGFPVEALHELYAPPARDPRVLRDRDRRVGPQWPVEDLWVTRLEA